VADNLFADFHWFDARKIYGQGIDAGHLAKGFYALLASGTV
jgi:hypothetical protein